MHVDENAIIAFVDGGLSPLEVSQFRQHLDGCPDCVALVAGVVKHRSPGMVSTIDDGAVAALAAAEGSAPNLPPPAAPGAIERTFLEPGATVGRYVVERLIGIGGMGVVYVARDPRLDRAVALKLIRRELGDRRAEYVERLRRESKALARLSHPNVTAVYELGEAPDTNDQIYVAMEYVAGTNLRAWLLEDRRGAREVLDTFVRAGRGLAAAHAAGLVHRDFKPDNVLLGSDGSVKVTDFGLARLASDAPASTDVPVARLADGSAEHEITRTGALIGTPAYMAPEQFLGGTVDARADQFAFCIALYEALHGERPFRGDTLEELRTAVLAGRVAPARNARVPGRVRRALVRGLAASPDRRFATMDALLDAIAPRARRWTVLAGGLAAAAGASALAITLLGSPPEEQVCRGAAAEAASVWNTPRRDALRRAFVATGARDAAATWTEVERGLDRYVEQWRTMHGAACEATRVHHQQSEAVLDLRMACLERRRSELDALLGELGRADAAVVRHAREAVGALVALDTCADVEALGRRIPLPRDPVQRQRHDGLRLRIDQARALVEVARYREALPALDSIVADPALAQLPALAAEAQHVRAKVLVASGAVKDSEQALFQALVGAQAARNDALVATVAVDLAHVVGYRDRRAFEGKRWADFAHAAISGKGGDELLGVRLAVVRAHIEENEGKLDVAEQLKRTALETASRRDPGGRLEAEVLNALGSNLAMQGKLDEAVPMLRRALAARERIHGKIHSLTSSTRMNLANALGTLNQFDESIAHYRDALAVEEELLGRDSYEVSTVLVNLGKQLVSQRKLAEGRPVLERALAIREKTRGPDHPAVAKTTVELGYLLLEEKAYADALARFEQSLATLQRAFGPEHPSHLDSITGIGLAYIGLERSAEAVPLLERAIALQEKFPLDPVAKASVQSKLALALWKAGDKPRAREVAKVARAVLADAGEHREVADIDAMLAGK